MDIYLSTPYYNKAEHRKERAVESNVVKGLQYTWPIYDSPR